MSSRQDVFVSGVGCFTAIGQNCVEFRNSLESGTQNFRLVEKSATCRYIEAAPAPFSFLEKVDKSRASAEIRSRAKKLGHRSSASVQATILTVLEAWEDADLLDNPDPARIGIVISGNNLNQQLIYDTYRKYGQQPEYLQPGYAQQFLDTNLLGILSHIFNIKGEGLLVGAASASGNVALIQGARLIRAGFVDACLVVGAMADLSPVEITALQLIGAMVGSSFCEKPNLASRPFDEQHEGFVYGRGSGCVVLVSREALGASTDRYWGKVKGEAICLDANSSTNPNQENESAVMRKAVERAGINMFDVEYINTHGSSSPLGDETELAAVQALFGEHKPYLNSTKSLTGHCLWSAGIIEAIAVLNQINNGFLHPDPNLDRPISSDCSWVGRAALPASVTTALSNSFGFGGINTSIVFESGSKS